MGWGIHSGVDLKLEILTNYHVDAYMYYDNNIIMNVLSYSIDVNADSVHDVHLNIHAYMNNIIAMLLLNSMGVFLLLKSTLGLHISV